MNRYYSIPLLDTSQGKSRIGSIEDLKTLLLFLSKIGLDVIRTLEYILSKKQNRHYMALEEDDYRNLEMAMFDEMLELDFFHYQVEFVKELSPCIVWIPNIHDLQIGQILHRPKKK